MRKKHEDIVDSIRRQVGDHYANKVPFRVYHGSTNSTRVLTFKRNEMVDVSELNRVLSIDKSKRTALVEPNVSMDKLVNKTLKHGLIPQVVTEFPGITVGGGIQGAAAETSSHKYGCFSQTVNWMEMVLGDGTMLKVSPNKHADLFYGTAGSYGSLGLVTAAELQLIPAKKYVSITHHPVNSFEQAVRLTEKFAKSSFDFIECLMFQKNQGSVITGKLTNNKKGKVRRFSRPFDTWYYLYVEKTAKLKKEVTETIPLKDYLFRYNRGAFWGGKLAFDHFGVKFNALNRFLLDPMLRTRKLYQALQESAAAQMYICQDIVLPTSSVLPFMEFIDKEFNMYPTGFCPIKPEPRSPLQCNGIKADLLFNVGVYGLKIVPYKKFVKANRQIESKTRELGGKKWFYAHSYYSEKEFWQIYDKKWYEALRKKYNATTLPDIYERTRVKKQQNVNSRRAAYKTILGRARLRVVD
jgi:hypothetical protein